MGLFGPHKPNLLLGKVAGSFPLWPQYFRLNHKQLDSHAHILGVSGTGKSFGLIAWFLDVFRQGRALTFIDPHSDSVNKIIEVLAARRFFERPDAFDKLWYIEWREDDNFVPYNCLRQKSLPHTVASNFKEAVHRAWPATAGGSSPMMDTLLQDAVKVLISNSLPLTSLYDLLSIQEYRNELLAKEEDQDIVSFFHNQFDRLSERDRADQAGAALRRAHLLTFNPALKYTLGQQDNILDFDRILDEGISVLFNIGNIQDIEARRLIGCLLTIGYEQAAIGRENPARARTPHILVLDEMAEFVSQSEQALSRLLSQTRKYGLFAWLCHQTWSQASERLRGALQNCWIEINFGIGYEDAQHAARILGSIDPEAIRAEAKTETQHDVFKDVSLQWAEQTQWLRDLPERNALIKVRGKPTVQIVTPTVRPTKVSPKYIEQIKAEYRRRLTRPKSAIELVHRRTISPVTHTSRFGPIGSISFSRS